MRRPHIPIILLTYPFELCVSIIVLLAGIQSVARGKAFSTVVQHDLYFFMALVWEAGAILGSIMTLAALLLWRPSTSVSGVIKLHGIERAGLILSGASAFVFSVVVFARGSGSGYAIGMLTGVGAACVLRSIALRRADSATVRAYESMAASDAH